MKIYLDYFRTSQNWIGPIGANINDAIYVPPPPFEMKQALGDLENFIHQQNSLPPLIQNALIHAQFETIHPFLDGNGRIGRLLITFLLMNEDILQKPLLYLSYYLKRNRQQYYDLLNKVRFEGDWELWIKFFLKGIYEVSKQATNTAKRIVRLQNKDRELLAGDAKALTLLDSLFYKPMVTTKSIGKALDVSASTANRIVSNFEEKEILVETTGFSRNRKYIYSAYVSILKEGTNQEEFVI